MKKIYQQPETMTMEVDNNLPIAASPTVTIDSSSSVDANQVDVKNAGDWGDIWDE